MNLFIHILNLCTKFDKAPASRFSIISFSPCNYFHSLFHPYGRMGQLSHRGASLLQRGKITCKNMSFSYDILILATSTLHSKVQPEKVLIIKRCGNFKLDKQFINITKEY